jgi:hypothetical protein
MAAPRRRSRRSPIESARRWSSVAKTNIADASRSFVRLHLTGTDIQRTQGLVAQGARQTWRGAEWQSRCAVRAVRADPCADRRRRFRAPTISRQTRCGARAGSRQGRRSESWRAVSSPTRNGTTWCCLRRR